MSTSAGTVTEMLAAWSSGDESARDSLIPLIYDELRRLARRQMRSERAGHTLQTTALVHEAFLRLAGQRRTDWATRAQFFAVASTMMRRILVDHARRRLYGKRGGGATHSPVEVAMVLPEGRRAELLAVDDALVQFATIDERACQIVEMRYFGGLTTEQIASVLGISQATVKRDWAAARAWLARELETHHDAR